MQHDWVLWIMVVAIVNHTIEERWLDWLPWGKRRLAFHGSWEHYYLLSGALWLAVTATAMIGWRFPVTAIGMIVLMYIDALVLHILPSVRYREFSPGVLSSVLLYLPVASISLYCAQIDGVLSSSVLLFGLLLGFFYHFWLFLVNQLIPWRERQTGNAGGQ
jgi:hypothetical protein